MKIEKVILIASAFAVLFLVTLPHADAIKVTLRQFYLTKTTHTGDVAVYACAAGFHMASMRTGPGLVDTLKCAQ